MLSICDFFQTLIIYCNFKWILLNVMCLRLINMEIIMFLVTFLCSLKLSSSIRCYMCDPELSFHRHIPICDHFNTADEAYITDCPKSTMCVKRVTTLNIGNGLNTRSVQRGCASQTTDGEQRKVNKGWESVNIVYEPYEEGCIDDPNNAERATKTLLCYCRGELCNSAGKPSIALWTLLLPFGITLLTRKWSMF